MTDDYYPDDVALADVAENWQRSQGLPVPERETPEWQTMYEAWVNFAFQDFKDTREVEITEDHATYCLDEPVEDCKTHGPMLEELDGTQS